LCLTVDQFSIAAKIIEVLPGIDKEKVMKEISACYTQFSVGLDAKGKHPLVRFREVVDMDGRCFGIISEYCP
jgi:hypothetical protein